MNSQTAGQLSSIDRTACPTRRVKQPTQQVHTIQSNWSDCLDDYSLVQVAMQHSIEYLIATENKYRAILWNRRKDRYLWAGDRWRPIGGHYRHVVTEDEQDIHTLLDILGVARLLKQRREKKPQR